MPGRNPWWVAMCLALVLAACSPLPPIGITPDITPDGNQDAQLLRIFTSWEARSLAEELSKAFESKNQAISIEIIPGHSEMALGQLGEEKSALALITQLPSEKPQASAQPQDTQTRMTLAMTGLAVIVHRDRPLVRIASADLQSLYAGYVTDWNALEAGVGQPEILSRQPETIARHLFDQVILQTQTVTSAALLLPHEQSIVDYVGQNPLATGYITLGAIDDRVHTVSIDGVAPSLSSVADGSYPLVLYIELCSPLSPSAEAKRWIAFAHTRDGQQIIQRDYLLPD